MNTRLFNGVLPRLITRFIFSTGADRVAQAIKLFNVAFRLRGTALLQAAQCHAQCECGVRQ